MCTLQIWWHLFYAVLCISRMPEFRFRRKKKKQQSSRRHTVHDPEEAHAQVVAAREMVTREEVTA